jgi:hypothetical protein
MSRRIVLRGTVAVLALAVSAPAVVGQQANAEREREIVEQLDRLMVHFTELREADDTLDSILVAERRAATTFNADTAAVGPFLVTAKVDQIDDAVEVYSAAWSRIEKILSGWPTTERLGVLPYLRSREAFRSAPTNGVFVRPWHPRSRAEGAAFAAIQKRIFDWAMPRGTRMWAPELDLRGEGLEMAYFNLILTPAISARKCYEGDADRCWDALGLRNVETSWESWYDADERRAWARRGMWTSGGDQVEVCPAGTAQCLVYVKARQEDAPIPAQPYTRASFLGFALRVGGEGALVRLNAGDETTSLAERLVSASGLSPDDLVESWREEVLAAAPPAKTGLSLKLLSGALLWSLVMSGLAMRSTRWRA